LPTLRVQFVNISAKYAITSKALTKYIISTLSKKVFIKKGINMRLKWIILAKIRRRDMKEKLDVDIIVRTLKKY
jgi:hypothetical protein